MKLYKQKHGKLSEAEAQEFAARLIKAGYTVAVKQEKIPVGTGPDSKGWVVEAIGDDGK